MNQEAPRLLLLFRFAYEYAIKKEHLLSRDAPFLISSVFTGMP